MKIKLKEFKNYLKSSDNPVKVQKTPKNSRDMKIWNIATKNTKNRVFKSFKFI